MTEDKTEPASAGDPGSAERATAKGPDNTHSPPVDPAGHPKDRGTEREGFFRFLGNGASAARAALRSPDARTRRAGVAYFAIASGVLLLGVDVARLAARRSAREKAARIEREERAAADSAAEAERRRALEPPPYESLGTFSLELREPETLVRSPGLRAAEMEIVVACSDVETCAWLKSRRDLARGRLGSLFTPMDRERILSPAGKKAFREEIRDALNRYLEAEGVAGTVVEVLFPRFIVS